LENITKNKNKKNGVNQKNFGQASLDRKKSSIDQINYGQYKKSKKK
jgi:hypothetical protein